MTQFTLQSPLKIMKISIVLLFICTFGLVAENTHSQNKKISFEIKSTTINNAISKIEKDRGYIFIYNEDVIPELKKEVLLQINDENIEVVLNKLFTGTSLAYSITGRQVTVYKKKELDKTASINHVEQQNGITVRGKVIDANNDPIIGATIVEKGNTSHGTITDVNGDFTLTNTSSTGTLIFTYVGMKAQEATINGRTTINIVMESDAELLDEVVVVGYGTQRRSDVTTAVSSVSSDNLKERAVINFGEAMAGQVAGVQIQQTNGSPGGEGLSVRVRGVGSITQSNDPLYVIDGYPMEGGAFRLLNPSDIESIQILKDASSSAIYGSRGANGVVIITTKKGKKGTPIVRLNSYVGFQQREKEVKMMNRDQYVQWFIDGRNQAWLDAKIITADPDKSVHKISDTNARRRLYPSASTQYMIPDGTDGYKYNFNDPASVAQMEDNNWQDLLFREALMQQYELSVSGGTDNTQYTFSGSYIYQDGIVLNTAYDRFNFRTNISSNISDKLNVGMTLMAYTTKGKEQANGKDAPIMYALNLPPIYPLKNEDGSYGSMVRNPEILAGDVASPIGIAELVYNNRKRYGWLGTLFAEWTVMNDLKYRISINGGIQDNINKTYRASYIDFDASKAPRPAEGTNERWTDRDWVIENTLTYSKTFIQKHAVNLLAGYTTQAHSYEHMDGEARGFPNDNITTLNAGTMYALTSDESEYSMISYLGRVNYIYDNRYLLTATIRKDGSYRFGSNRKWGTFPSFSVGWRISQESFMQDIKQISDLKLRSSFGVSGNNRIGNYSSIGLLSTGFYPTGDALEISVNPDTMPNYNLGWEKTQQLNIGLELGLFDNRIKFEADFYDSRSVDLLLNVPVPTITGYSTQMQNIGKVQNKGMEYAISTRNFTGDFSWSTDFNISFNKNKVLEVGVDERPIFAGAANANNSFITMPGYPIASFYGYVYEGIFKSQDELDKYPHLPADKIGDGRYKDVNDDDKLDQNDKTIIGDNHPIFTAGLNNTLSYRNFSLGVQLTSSYGAKTFSFWKRMVGIYHGDRNGIIQQLNRWKSPEEPGDGIHFRPTRTPSGWQRDPSSAWVQDASFLRLRNITLGYDFNNNNLIRKLGINALRLYITGTNLYTFTNYIGYDPENSSESGLSKGGDYMGYPAARSFILGANITF